jgi:hypothetical protein
MIEMGRGGVDDVGYVFKVLEANVGHV